MALKAKEPEHGAPAPNQNSGDDVSSSVKTPRINEEVQARLEPYIQANKETFERYHTLAKTNPERAARTLMLRDLDWLEREVSLKKNQIAGAKEWLSHQSDETKERIEKRLAETTHPQQRELALLQLVLNRMRFENSQLLSKAAKTRTAPALSA